MAKNWDKYSRQGLDIAHTASSFGFSAAKVGTHIGFSIARGIASTAVGITTTVLDFALFGGSTVTRPVFGLAVSSFLTVVEQITLAPIYLSEYITSTSLLAAHSSINALSVIFPGSSDASFSLASFINLVRREWNRPAGANGTVPVKQYGITQIARAIVGWVSLQGVTQEWQEERWIKYLKELNVEDAAKTPRTLSLKSSRVRVTSDIIFSGHQGPQIISADIGDPEPSSSGTPHLFRARSFTNSLRRRRSTHSSMLSEYSAVTPSNSELKATIRRLSKLVLAGYGGASLLFFGVTPSALNNNCNSSRLSESSSIVMEKRLEETQLAHAVDASEAEAAGESAPSELDNSLTTKAYSWWDVLLGRHDQEIFEQAHAGNPQDSTKLKEKSKRKTNLNAGNTKATAVIGNEHLMPRFWVLTDHSRGEIVLVIRGTMSLNEIAVDLTCYPESFQPAVTPSSTIDKFSIPGHLEFPKIADKEDLPSYSVHEGMLKMAKAMGDVGKPVHMAVLEALFNNPEFDLVLCGHSLGAGVAALLGLMWADPTTCLTVPSSGLPVDRQVNVFAFGPPCLTDASLSRLSRNMIVSLVYSHDIVARLSLGSVLDLRNAAAWLCEAEAGKKPEGWSAVTAIAKKCKDGKGSKDDINWLISIRKTLEANMQSSNMYPTGRVLWAMRDSDLHPKHRLHLDEDKIPSTDSTNTSEGRLRLFEVLDVEKVFSQIVFARNMLSAHMPHQYDRILHDML